MCVYTMLMLLVDLITGIFSFLYSALRIYFYAAFDSWEMTLQIFFSLLEG